MAKDERCLNISMEMTNAVYKKKCRRNNFLMKKIVTGEKYFLLLH